MSFCRKKTKANRGMTKYQRRNRFIDNKLTVTLLPVRMISSSYEGKTQVPSFIGGLEFGPGRSDLYRFEGPALNSRSHLDGMLLNVPQ